MTQLSLPPPPLYLSFFSTVSITPLLMQPQTAILSFLFTHHVISFFFFLKHGKAQISTSDACILRKAQILLALPSYSMLVSWRLIACNQVCVLKG